MIILLLAAHAAYREPLKDGNVPDAVTALPERCIVQRPIADSSMRRCRKAHQHAQVQRMLSERRHQQSGNRLGAKLSAEANNRPR
ncbi:hypothetical protein [Bradyrhizobium sp. CCBAU 51753]|uniref:hypothetical protein n=1 Tax=Bradyrhizobium sp. CCBAU 51753 TaxID=1325100 RepID=UPI00188DA170|nr:hypothetical protein [Bradyrhizobium sp. CCBAU 51753]